ncbi:MAG: glycoside hydrolase family 1 protein [Myxococcota bacterium]|nr:glycoside hydrolase family 1 protein [Myxococcota bacterium]
MTWFFALVVVIYVGIVGYLCQKYPEPNWDWSSIDLDDLQFPEGFLWGSATAAHQVDGGNDNNNWSRWETEVDEKGKPRVHGGVPCGRAVEHWERYPEDIQLMRDALHLNSYRFSVEWSRIEPSPGEYDAEAIAHYHDMIDKLLEAGIAPMVTLHHFTNPLWFEDMGAFEHEENIAHFVRFARKMFEEYGSKVSRWCTINESGPYSVMGYGLGVFPPGVKNYQRMAHVLHHLMLAHVQVYDAIKSMPGGDQVEVGLVKNIFQFDPYRRWNLAHWIMCRVMESTYNDSILRFFKEGVFRVVIPTQARLVSKHPEAVGKADFMGLNYYANLLISPFMKQEPPFEPNLRPGQIVTDMPYAIYGEGLYRAIEQLSELGKPIIITENGIADVRDDRRAIWIQRYLYAVSRAIREGYDVRGFHYWSLLDNFEWAEGYEMRFGLIGVDYETQERKVMPGAQAYVDIIDRFSSHA